MNPEELLIADFLANSLLPTEKEAVQARIEQDQNFALAVRQQQMELVILQASHRAELKENLKQEIASRAPIRNIRPLWIGLAIAAVIAAIVLIINPFSTRMTASELAMSYVEPFPVQQIRGETIQADTAILLYQAGRYREAVEALKILDQSQPDFALMTASALVQVEAYKEAIDVLEGIESPGVFADVYLWDLALAYVLAQEFQKARPLLEEIAASSHFKREEAKKLLASAPLSQREGEKV